MIGEEIAINEHLEQHGIQPIETDLGEYIIQFVTNYRAISSHRHSIEYGGLEGAFRKSHNLPPDRTFSERGDV